MTATITTVNHEPTRDRWGRPLIVPPDGGKPRPYTRATTVAGTLDDLYGLMAWKQRQTAIGLADRPDLQLAVTAHRDDKKRLDDICEQALEASKSSAAATTGTALHTLTEMVDRGQELPTLPPSAAADVEAYRRATASLESVVIEQMTVLDEYQIAGTPDRVVRCPDGRYRIADLKSGSVDYAGCKISVQLAIYAHAQLYDIPTGQRSPMPELDLDTAIVIHLPAGSGRCELLDVNIAAGWEAVEHSIWAREWRKRRDLITARASVDFIAELITVANDVPDLEALYHTYHQAWTDQHTDLARQRKQQLVAA
jgi:hypothetical protein